MSKKSVLEYIFYLIEKFKNKKHLQNLPFLLTNFVHIGNFYQYPYFDIFHPYFMAMFRINCTHKS